MNKISIIVPCNNGERTLARCLDSILNQTYKNFEVIIVDDGSTDRTYEIAQQYTLTDSRIHIIRCEENKGVSSARNLGLCRATGDYLEFIDADDELLSDALEKLYTALTENDADVAVCNFTGNPMFLTYMQDAVYDMTVESDVLKFYEDTFCFLLPWNKLFRRHVVQVHFDQEVSFGEDEVFNLAVLHRIKKVACIGKPLYIYHFAPAENVQLDDTDKKSCLNEIIDNTDENSKNSIWYLYEQLVPKRNEILKRDVAHSHVNCPNTDDLLYARIFDMLLCEMSAFEYNKAPRQVVLNEVKNVLREKNFIASVKIQEKHGLKFTDAKGKELDKLCELYVDACDSFYKDNAKNNLGLKFYNVFMQIFFLTFCERQQATSKEYNRLMETVKELENSSSKEARYVNSMEILKSITEKVTL